MCVCVRACACPWDVGQLPLVPSAFCVINEQSSALGEVPHFLRDTLKGVTGGGYVLLALCDLRLSVSIKMAQRASLLNLNYFFDFAKV